MLQLLPCTYVLLIAEKAPPSGLPHSLDLSWRGVRTAGTHGRAGPTEEEEEEEEEEEDDDEEGENKGGEEEGGGGGGEAVGLSLSWKQRLSWSTLSCLLISSILLVYHCGPPTNLFG